MTSQTILFLGIIITALVVVGLTMTVLEFRKLERNPQPQNPNFPL
jgi:hypothetical protein